MEKNRVLTYSLLAFINNQSGIEDFSEIFIPLTKRALSKINCRGISKGLLEDVNSKPIKTTPANTVTMPTGADTTPK